MHTNDKQHFYARRNYLWLTNCFRDTVDSINLEALVDNARNISNDRVFPCVPLLWPVFWIDVNVLTLECWKFN